MLATNPKPPLIKQMLCYNKSMKRLILASCGFRAPETVQKCLELTGKAAKEISFGVINEAYVPYHFPHDWVIDDLISIHDNFSNNIELIPFTLSISEIEQRLSDKDVIFVVGGNTAYLKTVFDRSGFSKLLPELIEKKVYVGSSAGSMIVGHCPTKETLLKTSGEDEDFSVHEYLDLVPLEIIPHIHGKFSMPTAEAQVPIESVCQSNVVYGISDNAAVAIEDDKIYPIGKDFLVAKSGKIVQKG